MAVIIGCILFGSVFAIGGLVIESESKIAALIKKVLVGIFVGSIILYAIYWILHFIVDCFKVYLWK